jgi:hypothetical protein
VVAYEAEARAEIERPPRQRPTPPRAQGLPWGIGTKHYETLLPIVKSHASRFAKTAYIGMEETCGRTP